MTLTVGQSVPLSGDITQLKAVAAKAGHHVEDMLGYHHGRLARGYWICLLIGPLAPADFELAGNTLRSGGRLGLPQTHKSDDDARTRVHDHLIKEYGPKGYENLQKSGLANITLRGENRIAKVVPVMPDMKYGSPAKQYPMGGGSLQWRLKPPGKLFFVAAFVNAQGLAETLQFTARIDVGAHYDDRARLMRYLESAP